LAEGLWRRRGGVGGSGKMEKSEVKKEIRKKLKMRIIK
jgi:hypothetical protein